MSPPSYKRTVSVDSLGLSSPPNCKQALPADSSGSFDLSNRKRIVPSKSSGSTRTGTTQAGESPFPVKKDRHFNASLLPNYVK